MRILLLTVFLFFTICLSAQTIVTDRPDQTESAMTVPHRSLQIETGVQIEYGDRGERTILLPTTLLRVGLAKSFELRFVSQHELLNRGEFSANGISDLEIGFKLWLSGGEEAATNVALLTHALAPSASGSIIGNDDWGIFNAISISHDFDGDISLGVNFGHRYTDGRNDITYTAALNYGITPKLSLYIEPYGEYSEGSDEFSILANGGLAYLVKDNVQWDFSFGTGISETSNYISTGVSWLIK